MEWYPWLTPHYRALVRQYGSNRPHHALLLHTAKGMGGEQLVTALGYWLLCQHKQGSRICRQCHSCQLMQAGTHPDWYLLQVEEKKNQLSIEQIRTLIERLTTHTHQGGARVICIESAESLTIAAVNALLKTLEEPVANSYFILCCQLPAQLPATLRSRCFYYPLPAPAIKQAAQWLVKQGAGEMKASLTALRLCNGAPLAAEKLLQEPAKSNRALLCTALEQAIRQRDLQLLLPALQQGKVEENLHWLTTLLLDGGKWQLNARQFITNQDVEPLIAQLALLSSVIVLQRMAHSSWQCRQLLLDTTALNSELILTDYLCRWQDWLTD